MNVARAGRLLFFGLMGALFCLATAAVAAQLRVLPAFPAYGGEDDFSLRFTLFGVVVLPAFAILGGWIEQRALRRGASSARSWSGLLAGTVVALGVGRSLGGVIERLSSRSASNAAVAVFFGGWILLAALGAVFASKRAA